MAISMETSSPKQNPGVVLEIVVGLQLFWMARFEGHNQCFLFPSFADFLGIVFQ